MEVYINAAAQRFAHLLQRFAKIGFRGARIGLRTRSDIKSNLIELTQWARYRPISKHIYIVYGDTQEKIVSDCEFIANEAAGLGIAQHVIIEPMNEPDIEIDSKAWVDDPEGLGVATAAAWAKVGHTGVTVISPGVSNITSNGIEYARRMLSRMPGHIPFAFHRYVDDDLMVPVGGYDTRDDEMARVMEVAGGRELYVTETGQTETHYRTRPFPRCWQQERYMLSEDEVARQTVADMLYWSNTGKVKAVTYYQLNDGNDEGNPGHRQGWRHYQEAWDGQWKVVAQVTPEEIRKVDTEQFPETQAVRKPTVVMDRLFEPEPPPRSSFPCSISLFYGLSLGIDRDRFKATIDGLAGKVQEARLSMSTYTWGNPVGEPEVIPFKAGNHHNGYDNVVSQTFLDEMEVRLDYMVSKGVRPQLTLFWGGFQDMFVKNKGTKELHENAIRAFERAVMERGKNHPAVKYEWMNEMDHGHHLGFYGYSRRVECLRRHVPICKEVHPDALFGNSDGGHAPREWLNDHKAAYVREDGTLVNSKNEPYLDSNGNPLKAQHNKDQSYYDYRDVQELDMWHVHFPRDRVDVERIPRWCRGLWHLNGESFIFRAAGHSGKGFGQNDENIFLQTEAEYNEYPYNNSTRDWRMVGLSAYVALAAKSATTFHTHAGMFCRPEAGTQPIIDRVATAYQQRLTTFPLGGMASHNTGWQGAPVASYTGPFKAFCLSSGDDRREIIVTVLNPRQGELVFNLGHRAYVVKAYEITGEALATQEIGPGDGIRYRLPRVEYEHGCIVHLKAK